LFYGRTTLFMLRMAIPPFIPFMMEKFGWNSFELGLLASAYVWSYAFAQVPWGIAVDRWGGKKSLITGWTILVAASLAFALGSSLAQLMIARLIFGVGAASVLVASTVIIAEIYPKGEIGVAMGVIGSSSSIGTLLAGIAIPWLLAIGIQLLSLETWRAVCVAITLPAVLALFTLVWLPNKSNRILPAASMLPRRSQLSRLKREALRDPRLYLLSIAMLGYVGGFTISSTWIYVYMQQEYGLPLVLVGMIASFAVFVPAIPGALLSGWLSDYFNTRAKIAAAGAMLAGVSLFLLVFKLPLYVASLVLISYGTFALFHTPIFSMPAEIWAIEVSGTAFSIIAAISQIGAAAAPALTGFLLTQTNDYDLIWTLGSAAYFCSAIALLSTKERKQSGASR
jgi:ACS family D-galactonate transporter-like MFS transporter